MNRKNGRGKREKIFGDFPVSRKDKDQSERGKVRWVYERQKDNSELFKWDGKPSAGQVFPLAAQHVLAAVVGCVTPAILVANAANNAGRQCRYGTFNTDVSCLCGAVYAASVIWK